MKPDYAWGYGPFDQRIRFNGAVTAIFIENFWEILQRGTDYRANLMCDESWLFQGIKHLLLDCNWLTHGYDDSFSNHPLVKTFTQLLPNIEIITLMIEEDAIQLDDEKILVPGYQIYEETSPFDEIRAAFEAGHLSVWMAHALFVEQAEAYCALDSKQLFDLETEGKRT